MSLNFRFTILAVMLFFVSCKETTDGLFNKASGLINEGRYKAAIETYNELIQRNGKLPLAYYDRGICYLNEKKYDYALADFNKVIDLETTGNFIITVNKNMPYSNDEIGTQVEYYDALYQRAQVKYHMDSIRSSFVDFQFLIDNDYKEKSNCLLWQGVICESGGLKNKACEYFRLGELFAKTREDRQDADDYIKEYCSGRN
jgi:tetratricopeptide (TPR) repeat protein